MDGYAGYLAETFVTLLAVCAVAFAVLYGGRRLGLGRARGPIELVGQLPLDARRAIYLVKVGAQVLVVGVGEGGMSKLGEIPAADLPGPALRAEPAAPFAHVLGRMLSAQRPGRPDEPRSRDSHEGPRP